MTLRHRKAFGLLELLLGLMVILAMGLPTLGLAISATRRTGWERERLFLVGELATRLTEFRQRDWIQLSEAAANAEVTQELLVPEGLSLRHLVTTSRVEQLTPGLAELTVSLSWTDAKGRPRRLERSVLKARSTWSLETRYQQASSSLSP